MSSPHTDEPRGSAAEEPAAVGSTQNPPPSSRPTSRDDENAAEPAETSDGDVTSWPARASVAWNKAFGSDLEAEVPAGHATGPQVPDEQASPVDEGSLGDRVADLAADAADALLGDGDLGDEALAGVDSVADAPSVRAPQRAAATRRGHDETGPANPPLPMPHVRPADADSGARAASPTKTPALEAPRRPATTKRGGEAVVASPLLTMPRVRHPEAVVLFVHGGDVEGHLRMRRGDPAYLRIVPFARDVERRSRGRIGAATLRLAVRGWNEPEKPAVQDTRWALDELRRRYPGVPVALAGHSMGGRVALDIVSSQPLAAAVALAPWAAEAYDPEALRTTPLLAIHGRRDTVTDPVATKKLVDGVRAAGGEARFVSMPGWHAMLWNAGQWHRETSQFLIEHLLDEQDAHRRAR